MGKEKIPKIFGEIPVNVCKNGKEVALKGANGVLGSIMVIYIWRHELIGYFPFLLNNKLVLCANLITEDLEINLVTANAKLMHDGVIGCYAIIAFLGLERADKDGVGLAKIGSHDVLVSTVWADGEATLMCSLEMGSTEQTQNREWELTRAGQNF